MGYENVTLMNDEPVIQIDVWQEVWRVYGYIGTAFPAFKINLYSSFTTIKTWQHRIWDRTYTEALEYIHKHHFRI